MVETDPVHTTFKVDDSEVKKKFDEFERRIKAAESSGKKAGKGVSAFAAAAVGGAVGFVAAAVTQNEAVSSALDLLTNILAAALLPVLMAILPLIVALSPLLITLGQVLAPIVAALVAVLKPLADAIVALVAATHPENAFTNLPGSADNPLSQPSKDPLVQAWNKVKGFVEAPFNGSLPHVGNPFGGMSMPSIIPIFAPSNKDRFYGPDHEI